MVCSVSLSFVIYVELNSIIFKRSTLCICFLDGTFLVWQNGLDDEMFENYKSGLMGKLLEKDPSLVYETNRFWGQIVDKR